MSDKNTSTLQSYIDSAAGAAQSVLGSVTGSTADKQAAQQKHDKAQLEHDASHAGTTIAGHSVSTSGIAQNDPQRQEGALNQTLGSGKEFLGSLTGSESLKRDGHEQNMAGKGQEAQGQLNDLGTGVKERVAGTLGGAVAGATGDRSKEEEYRERHDLGKTLQRGVEGELQK
ncbi:hypothetical protein CJF31_00007553 [Rutstroemia sp. NJR-2017a BVV2]|nr:hypothetical protein CJF31_00007553 [Rutstroemia sp. NJR-2017a BVV2]